MGKIIPALKNAGFDGYLTAGIFKADSNKSWGDYYNEVNSQLIEIISKA